MCVLNAWGTPLDSETGWIEIFLLIYFFLFFCGNTYMLSNNHSLGSKAGIISVFPKLSSKIPAYGSLSPGRELALIYVLLKKSLETCCHQT